MLGCLTEGPPRRVTACIVEDDELLSEMIAELLAEDGVELVAAAATVRSGRDALLARRPSLAVIDNTLPDGRGLDLCAELRLACPETVVILYTGLLSNEEAQAATDAGVAAIVMKSIRMHELRDAVRRLVLGAEHLD